MILSRLYRWAAAAILAGALTGCFPGGSSQLDEEKEPHFQRGRSLVNSMDYGGAIEAFEKALEANPRSGAAHFELGWLYSDKQPEPSAAIYHYEQYLKLRPRASNTETVRQIIFRLKQDLAKIVLPLPSTPGVQRQLEQLMEQNKRLQEEVEKWRAYYANRTGSPPTNPPPAPTTTHASGRAETIPASPTSTADAAARPAPAGTGPVTRPAPAGSGAANAAARTHKVQPGETPSSIARKYTLKLDTLIAANPGLNPRRMQVGQVLTIPAP